MKYRALILIGIILTLSGCSLEKVDTSIDSQEIVDKQPQSEEEQKFNTINNIDLSPIEKIIKYGQEENSENTLRLNYQDYTQSGLKQNELINNYSDEFVSALYGRYGVVYTNKFDLRYIKDATVHSEGLYEDEPLKAYTKVYAYPINTPFSTNFVTLHYSNADTFMYALESSSKYNFNDSSNISDEDLTLITNKATKLDDIGNLENCYFGTMIVVETEDDYLEFFPVMYLYELKTESGNMYTVGLLGLYNNTNGFYELEEGSFNDYNSTSYMLNTKGVNGINYRSENYDIVVNTEEKVVYTEKLYNEASFDIMIDLATPTTNSLGMLKTGY